MAEPVIWGYARVSSTSQNLDRQIDALTECGVDERHLMLEKQSGKDFDRQNFLTLVGTDKSAPAMREGDCLVITSLDRLGRNYSEIRQWWQYITTQLKCDIVVLDMPLLNTASTDSSLDKRFVSDLVLQILSYVSEKERLAIKERQRQGIEATRSRGVRLGRPPIQPPENFAEVVKLWKSGSITAVEAMRRLGLSKHAFYKLVKEVSI